MAPHLVSISSEYVTPAYMSQPKCQPSQLSSHPVLNPNKTAHIFCNSTTICHSSLNYILVCYPNKVCCLPTCFLPNMSTVLCHHLKR